MTTQPAGNPQAKQALKDNLTQKAAPAWGNASASLALVKAAKASPTPQPQSQATSPPMPKPQAPPSGPTLDKVGITKAARKHYQDAVKANAWAGTSSLSSTDQGLKGDVVDLWAYRVDDGQFWRIDIGEYVTPGYFGNEPRPWFLLVAEDKGLFTVTHYGPGGLG
jgi:hypothetical protein